MTEEWDRQKRELDSYNVFFSAFKGRRGNTSLFNLGYRLVGIFMRISDNRQGITAEPDIVLYNGGTLLLVEIKSGTNIDRRTMEQLESMSNISIEAGQTFLQDADLDQYDYSDLNHIESVIVYYEDFIEGCRESSACSEALDQLSDHGAVLSQQKGGTLSIAEGKVQDGSLRSVLTEGIPLPQLPDTHIYLTENVNREILAYSIAHDCVRTVLVSDESITIKSEDVIERYRNRELDIRKVNDALEFLSQIRACTSSSEGEYTFRRANMSKILGVEEYLRKTRVRETLSGPGAGQQSLDDFADTDGDTD
jgi:hypothetical protein